MNNHASTSTFKTKLDIEHCQEFESQLEQQREEADAIIGNLRKTQQELLNQIKGLELRLEEAQGNSMQQTPSLANIEPRARSELNGGRKDAYSELGKEGASSQRLQMQLEEREAELRDLKLEHESQYHSMHDQFKTKVSEQTLVLDELKAELERAVRQGREQQEKLASQNSMSSGLRHQNRLDADEKQRLEGELQQTSRQL